MLYRMIYVELKRGFVELPSVTRLLVPLDRKHAKTDHASRGISEESALEDLGLGKSASKPKDLPRSSRIYLRIRRFQRGHFSWPKNLDKSLARTHSGGRYPRDLTCSWKFRGSAGCFENHSGPRGILALNFIRLLPNKMGSHSQSDVSFLTLTVCLHSTLVLKTSNWRKLVCYLLN